MLLDPERTTLLAALVVLTLLLPLRRVAAVPAAAASYLAHLWALVAVLAAAAAGPPPLALWILASLCFAALREYVSLLDLRLEDRWGIWGAYLAIPFLFWCIQTDWYGMFIISIPVYAFLVVPFLVSLGGPRSDGAVLSIGAIDFGLFLFVYCTGHIAYLIRLGVWRAVLLVAGVAVHDAVEALLPPARRGAAALRWLAAAPATVLLAWSLRDWAALPMEHALALGLLIPALAAVGRHTFHYLAADVGLDRERVNAGRGRVLDFLKGYVYAAPVVFHYVRYYLG